MRHAAIEQVLQRVERAKEDSDYTYFHTLLLAAEALAKTMVLGVVASIADDKDRNRYRLEHQLVGADGLGDWSVVFEDALSGPSAHYLLADAYQEQRELTQACKSGQWQHDATAHLNAALQALGVQTDPFPVKSDMKRWLRLFALLRNKTRGHGATTPELAADSAVALAESINIVYGNFCLFRRSWAHLYRNLNGKYRVSPISEDAASFDFLKRSNELQYPNGVYLFVGEPRRINLLASDPELRDFFFANGGLTSNKYELLSYSSGDKLEGDAKAYHSPPGTLPPSETQGHGELIAVGNCWTNVPDPIGDYVSRPKLEQDLYNLIVDDKWPIVTLVGRGGIGKTSLALKVIPKLYEGDRYECLVWLSARDVDLQMAGPRAVRPDVLSQDDMGVLYAQLVASPEELKSKEFKARSYLERNLHTSALGPCLFIFDNFETTRNPVEIFNWIASFIRPPNKVLITTRLRDFKGDYPVEVSGMEDSEAELLVNLTAKGLGVSDLLDGKYVSELIRQSEGHPYVIKVLLGEVAKARRAASIPHLVAGTGDVLTALFERTYAALSPCSQRAFLTLSAWNSPVPRLALEAVLIRSTEERQEVEKGIESLLQYSIAEIHSTVSEQQEFIGVPLVASVFGKKKLNISPSKPSIQADVEILQMLGPIKRGDVHLGLVHRIERFLGNISRRIETGASYDSFAPILEAICRSYNPGWLVLARWHMEERTQVGYERAKEELRRFLENNPPSAEAAEAWKLLGHACYQTGDALGEVHAFIERAQYGEVPFSDLSNTANRLNIFLKEQGFLIEREQKRELSMRLLNKLDARKGEAGIDDFSRMAWLAINAGKEALAREYVKSGLAQDGGHHHLSNLAQRFDITL